MNKRSYFKRSEIRIFFFSFLCKKLTEIRMHVHYKLNLSLLHKKNTTAVTPLPHPSQMLAVEKMATVLTPDRYF